MKKGITILILLLALSSINVNIIFADDEESTLDLDAEQLRNKQENYSSLTDVNGVKLFTNDLKIELENAKSIENSIEIQSKEILFSDEFYENTVQIQDVKKQLFKQPTVFDKILPAESTDITFASLFIVITIILGVIVFVLTKRKYLNKENEQFEDNNYIYD